MTIDTDFLGQLDRFSLVVRKRVTSNYIGPRRSIATGRGLMFKEHRIYAPGDDIRSIDWRLYARTDDLHVKTYEEERNLSVHVIVDGSASMDFGKGRTKFDYAGMLGVGFAYLAMKENEKFQFSTFSDSMSVFQPKRGMRQLIAMVDHLNSIKTKGKSLLKDSIKLYKKFIGSRSMIVLISDFLIPIEEINEALYLLGSHDIKLIQVLDVVEKELNISGDFKLKDSESDAKMRTFISPRLRMQYQEAMANHSAKIQETCNNLGIKFNLVTTDVPIFDAFYKVLE